MKDGFRGPAPSMDVRAIRNGEDDEVIALWRACGLLRDWNDPRADLEFARAKTNSTILVGRLDQKLVASVMVGHDGHRGAIYYLAVHPDFQRKGLGRAMLSSAEAWLLSKHIWKLNLMVRSDNTAILGFYERMGYEEADTVVMERWIDPGKKGKG